MTGEFSTSHAVSWLELSMAGARCPLQAPHAFVYQTGFINSDPQSRFPSPHACFRRAPWPWPCSCGGQRACGCAGAPPGVHHPTLNIINLVTVALENETRATVALLVRGIDAGVATSPPGYSYSQRASLQHADVNLVDLAWAPVHC